MLPDSPVISPVADEPRSPARMGLVRFGDDPGIAFLLEDFEAAFTAYAHISGSGCPEFSSFSVDGDEVDGTFDSIVLGMKASDLAQGRLMRLATLAQTGGRLYAIIDTDGLDSAEGRPTAMELKAFAQEHGLLWGGAAVLATGGASSRFRPSPRMGLLRRPFSETMDKLVGAARMSCSVACAQELGGADVDTLDRESIICAKPALPGSLWQLIMRQQH